MSKEYDKPNNAEQQRLKTLENYHILDTKIDPSFDRITKLAAQRFQVPVALISLVDHNRQWFKSAFGLDIRETDLEHSICQRAIQKSGSVCICDLKKPGEFASLVDGKNLNCGGMELRFYAGAPLVTPEGYKLGMLCILSDKPNPDFNKNDEKELKLLADLAMDLLDRHKTNVILRETENTLEMAMDEMNDGIWEWFHMTDSMNYTNRLLDMLGYTRAEMPQTWQKFSELIHGDDINQMTDLMQSLIMSDKVQTSLVRFWHKNGEVRYFRCKARTIFDHKNNPIRTIGVFSDETSLHDYQKALEESEKRFRDVVDTSGEYIWEIDKDGKFSFLTERISEILGYSADSLVGKKLMDLLPEKSQSLFKSIFSSQSYQPKHFHNIEHEIYHRDGHIIWQSISGSPMFDDEGFFLGYRGTGSNITARKQQEQALHLAMIESEKATRAKSQFLATMSHEIRTPLNAIIGMADILKDTKLSDDQEKYLDTIENSGNHLLHLVNDILDYSKLDAGEMVLEKIPFSLVNEINDTMNLFSHSAHSKNIRLETVLDDHLPEYIIGDAARLRQILLNLISNAIKFTSKGSVKLTAKHDPPGPVQAGSRVNIIFSISDTGIGISQDTLPLLFKEFSQADSSTTREFGGTGLGLAICKQLTEIMGGTIEAESELGSGSIFTFTIPYTVIEKELQAVSDPVEAVADLDQSFRILVAEDSPNNQFLLKTMLTKMGHKVSIANDGIEAIEAVKHVPFDLIIMDMQMPQMDGMEAIKHIRGMNEKIATTPVVVLTADVMNFSPDIYKDAGFDDALTKPINKKRLREVIIKWGAASVNRKKMAQAEDKTTEGDPAEKEQQTDNAEKQPFLYEGLIDEDLFNELLTTLERDDFDEIYTNYWIELENDVKELIQSFKENKTDEIQKLAHKMKGTAASHAALGLSEILSEIELKFDQADTLKALIPEMLQSIDDTQTAIENLSKDETEPN